jgi:hypothetical protein
VLSRDPLQDVNAKLSRIRNKNLLDLSKELVNLKTILEIFLCTR